MDLATRRTIDATTTSPPKRRTPVSAPHPPPRPPVKEGPRRRPEVRRQTGVAAGINIAPGSDDDGWVVPPPVTLSDGTRLQLYKDGEALHAAYEAIKHARRRVCLESYIFADDDTGRAFGELLCAKARDGIAVYLLYDSFGSFSDKQLWCPKPAMFDRMRRSGVRMQEFHPMRPWESRYSWRPVNRDHRKLLIVDDDIGGMGGLNVGREYAGSWVVASSEGHQDDPWRDNAIGLVGPAVRHLLRAFAAAWSYCARGGRIQRAFYEFGLKDRDEPFGLLASVPTMCSPLQHYLCQYLRAARKSIEMTMAYFAPDDQLINELLRAARRGVRVRLMLPARSDVKALIWAAQSFYDRLIDAGVEIYERQSVILHAKTMSVDQAHSIVGSSNLDSRSIEYNCELSAIIRNETFGKQMHDLFENDVCYAKRIDPALWRERPMRDRFVQWAVSRARYLL
jgi:cardiolipin synthase